jgi:putative ABC transport system permease protein
VASRPDLSVFLKDVRRDGGSSGGRRRLRGVLIAAQVALALVLLAGAGLALRSFDRLTHVDPGFRTANVMTFVISLPEATYPSMASQTRFFRDYTDRVRQIPGVAAAGAVSIAPVTRDGFGGSFTIYGRPEGADEGNAQVRSITPGYFEALTIPLTAGRRFTTQDIEDGPRVALVSEAAARRFWPGENPVGKQLRLHVNEAARTVREIVGVVGDVRTRGMEIEPAPVVYVPHTQYGPEAMTIAVRTQGEPMEVVPQLKAALKTLGPGVAISRARTMEDLVSRNVAEPRFRTLLLSVFALVSLVLAAVGLYGVVGFSVSQRRSELGLRMALGADPHDVLRLVMREGMTPVAAGIFAGLAGAALVARVMTTLLFGVDAFDPVTFAGVAGALTAVALAACYIPARRATRLDPATTLR